MQLKNETLLMCSKLSLPEHSPDEEPATKLLHFEVFKVLLQQQFGADLLEFKSEFLEQFLKDVQTTEKEIGSTQEAN